MSGGDLALSIALGIGLAAAVGLRVFLPMLVMSIAAYTGHLTLGSGFAWLATPAALLMLSVAALLEILAYYIPGLDNLLDLVADLPQVDVQVLQDVGGDAAALLDQAEQDVGRREVGTIVGSE